MSKARELAELGAVYDSGALSNRNLVINGAMQIAQRTTSDASISDNEFVCDRFSLRTSNAGWYGAEQSTDAPTGFSHSIKFESTGANSPAAGAYIFFTQKIEGFNSAHLEFGTSNAKTITISFHIKSSLTGTFGGSLRNSAQNRSYPFSFTISSANTWEYKTVTIAGDTTGTWIGSTNGIGLDVIFNLGSGTNNQGTAGAWAAAGYLKPTGAVNLVETSGATLFFTGLQLEVGTEATPFEHRLIGDELRRCQRYFYKLPIASFGPYLCQYVSTNRFSHIWHPVPMRAVPTSTTTMSSGTVTEFSPDTHHTKYYNSAGYADSTTFTHTSYQADAEL